MRRLVDQEFVAVELPVLGVEGDRLDPAESVAAAKVDPRPVRRPVAGRDLPAVEVEDDPLDLVDERIENLGHERGAAAPVPWVLRPEADRSRACRGAGIDGLFHEVEEVDDRVAPASVAEVLGQDDGRVRARRKLERSLEGEVLRFGNGERNPVAGDDAAVLAVESGADPPRRSVSRRRAGGRHDGACQPADNPLGRCRFDPDRGHDFDPGVAAFELAVELALEGAPQSYFGHVVR
ncbi:MAG: hypothetical protein F4210_08850 [Holophagales bacterium]|nr:hypothetical protein [Holophagales bacterium]